MYVILGAVTLVVIFVALADIITREEWQVKHLPKFFWVIVVILLPFVGSLLWFTVGREYSRPVDLGSLGDPRRWNRSSPEKTAGSSMTGDTVSLSSTERELARLEQEIALAEQADRIRQLERELEARPEREENRQ